MAGVEEGGRDVRVWGWRGLGGWEGGGRVGSFVCGSGDSVGWVVMEGEGNFGVGGGRQIRRRRWKEDRSESLAEV